MQQEATSRQKILVTGVIGDDVHIIGLRILEHALRKEGFKVVSLGIQVSQEEFVEAAKETAADAILVSSLSGHGQLLVEGFKEKCIEAGLKNIPMVIGGQLMMHDMNWENTERVFKELGFDKVYPPSIRPSQAVDDLKAFLGV